MRTSASGGWVSPLLVILAVACSTDRQADRQSSVPLWMLSAEPSLQIGVVEGDPNYELHGAKSSVRLSDGGIVVANTGTQELWFFDSDGRSVSKAGGRGGGPGEFQYLRRIYLWDADTIMAYDDTRQVSFFDKSGQLARSARVDSLFEEGDFPMDVWLHRRFWVEGAREPAAKAAVRAVLDGLHVPDSAPGYRVVRAGWAGTVWIGEPHADVDDALSWTIVGRDRNPVAIMTPPRFEIHQIGFDFVLGRWRDGDDVNFIRVHGVSETSAREAIPAWLTVPAVEVQQSAASRERQMVEMRTALRNLVMHQEMYFANNIKYADHADSLEMDLPDGLTIDLVKSGTGWTAVATLREAAFICAMAIGSPTPPGWPEGSVRCG